MAKAGTIFKSTGKKVTYKQQQFVKELIKNKGNQGQAYIDAGYSVANRKVARSEGSKLMSNPNVQEELTKTLNDVGLTDTKVFGTLEKAMQSGLGEKATNTDSLRAIDMYLKLKKLYPTTTKRIEKVDLTLDLTGKSLEELKVLLDKNYQGAKEVIDGEVLEDK